MKYGIKLVVIVMFIIIAAFLALKLQNKYDSTDVHKPTKFIIIETTAFSTVAKPTPTPTITIEPTPTLTPLSKLPEGFVYITDVIPNANLDIRYYSSYNFVGERIEGYKAPTAILTIEAAKALKKAADDLYKQGYIITIYDAYRPQKAVQHFVRWSEDPDDIKMKDVFYPAFYKSYLIGNYISSTSSHSRGSTVDLSILDFEGNEIDMGSYFDLFDSISRFDSDKVTDKQRVNRKVLRDVMVDAGFTPSNAEWWHFRLTNEPFADAYFDFDVE